MRLRHAVPVTLIVAIAAGACAAASLGPELSVRKAAGELGDDRIARYTLSVQGDEQAHLDFPWVEPLTAEDIEMMRVTLHSELSVVWDRGDERDDSADDRYSLDVSIDGIDHAVEARLINDTIYARAEIARLVDRFNPDAQSAEDVALEWATLGIDFVDEAVNGGWLAHEVDPIVSFYKAMAGQFEQGFEEEAGFPMPDLGDLGPGMLSDVVDAFGKAYGKDAKVEEGKADGPGKHYVISASARRIFEHLLPAIKELPVLKAIPDIEYPSAEDVPDETYALDLWISDGDITRVEFDLAQVAPDEDEGMPRLAVRLDIDRKPGDIAVPDDVKKLDIFEIIGKLAAAGGPLES